MNILNEKMRFMASDDERQYMLNEDFEIFEKYGAPVGATKLHYHDFYEVIYVMDGEFSSLIDNSTYYLKKGDFLLIDRNLMHNYHFVENRHENSRRIILWITAEMLGCLSGEGMDLNACFSLKRACAYHFPAHYEELLSSLLVKIVMTDLPGMENLKGKDLLDRAHLTQFFVYLNELCGRQDFFFTKEEATLHPVVKDVAGYVDAHVSEAISLDNLAEHVHMSKYHFLRKFKELTGMTVHRYIINRRLMLACQEMHSGCQIAQIYQRTGFSDYSSFFRNFKAVYGLSPREYRNALFNLPQSV